MLEFSFCYNTTFLSKLPLYLSFRLSPFLYLSNTSFSLSTTPLSLPLFSSSRVTPSMLSSTNSVQLLATYFSLLLSHTSLCYIDLFPLFITPYFALHTHPLTNSLSLPSCLLKQTRFSLPSWRVFSTSCFISHTYIQACWPQVSYTVEPLRSNTLWEKQTYIDIGSFFL